MSRDFSPESAASQALHFEHLSPVSQWWEVTETVAKHKLFLKLKSSLHKNRKKKKRKRWQSYLSKLWCPSEDIPQHLGKLLSGNAVGVIGRLVRQEDKFTKEALQVRDVYSPSWYKYHWTVVVNQATMQA